MKFGILGPTQVRAGGVSLDLPAGRARALLALLILHAGQPVAADRLIDELWGEHPPPTAATVVHGFVSRLRKLLEPGRRHGEDASLLQSSGAGYRLSIEPDLVDANRFQRLVSESARLSAAERSDRLREALALWRGPALADFTYEPFAQRAITALEDLKLTALEERLEADLASGRGTTIVAELEGLIAEYPFRERLHGLQMLALYRAGRQADSLAAYQRARGTLREELGVEPGPALRELEAAILRQDPSLQLVETPTPRVPSPPVETAWLPSERRTVTVAAINLVSSAATDPEAAAADRARALDVSIDVLTRYRARVEHPIGDALMAFFGFPVAHEDDALRAVHAASELADTIGAQAGIETGDIVVSGAGGAVVDLLAGPVVTAAYRLAVVAEPGAVILGAATQRLTSGTVLVMPAPDVDGARTWRVTDIVSDRGPTAAASSLFGRHQDLTTLRAAWHRSTRAGKATRFVLTGEAGIGKSRLAEQFVESVGGAAEVITGRCAAYGEGITFLPLHGVFERLPGWQDLDVTALFAAVRALLAEMATQRPVLVVLDDLHWAEPTLLDLVDDVVGAADGPIFLLCVGRPDLLERRPVWAGSDALPLGPLTDQDVAALLTDRAGGVAPPRVRELVRTAQGNPLFAEQLLAAADELAPDDVPASLQGLLAARLDALGPGERDLLRSASVIGTEWSDAALSALLPEAAREFATRHVLALARTQLVERTDDGGRFRHVLIQRAAYRSMTKRDRAAMHVSYAQWLRASDSAPEMDELVGYHLEQAVLEQRAIGDHGTEALAVTAAGCLAAGGERAYARVDLTAAQNLLSRARNLLPSGHPLRLKVTQRLAEFLLPLGRFNDAQDMLIELAEAAAANGDRSAELFARLEHARIQHVIGPDPVPLDTIRRQADVADEYFAQVGDDAGEQRASFLLGCVHERAGRLIASEQAFRRSLTLADRSGDTRERVACRWMLVEALTLGPTPVDACIAECDELTASLGFDYPVLCWQAVLEAMRLRFDAARALTERASQTFAEQGRMLMFVADAAASIALLAGDPVAAERELRTVWTFARDTAEPEHLAPSAAKLARVLVGQGRLDEAAEFASLSAEHAPREGAEGQALSRAALALVASARAEQERAVNLAQAAASTAPDEMLNMRADVLLDLATVLRGNGRGSEAVQATDQARALYRAKGNLAALAWARTRRTRS